MKLPQISRATSTRAVRIVKIGSFCTREILPFSPLFSPFFAYFFYGINHRNFTDCRIVLISEICIHRDGLLMP
jgi:hypothetical protein